MSGLLRPVARLLAAVGLAVTLALAGCVITGPADLVADAEAVTPLPDSFTMVPYDRDEGEPDWTISNEQPMPFTRDGAAYVIGDGSLIARLAPIDLAAGPNAPPTETTPAEAAPAGADYVLAITAPDGNDPPMFGLLHHDGDILAIRLVFQSVDEALAMLVHDAPPDIAADIVTGDGGIAVTRRATLDYLLARFADGTLDTRPLVAFIGSGDPPAHIGEVEGSFVAVN